MQEIPAFSPSTDTGETVTACSDNFSTSNLQRGGEKEAQEEEEAGTETELNSLAPLMPSCSE